MTFSDESDSTPATPAPEPTPPPPPAPSTPPLTSVKTFSEGCAGAISAEQATNIEVSRTGDDVSVEPAVDASTSED